MQLEVSHLNEECGVFGVWGTPDAAFLTYTGLFSLQHRGQEGAGITINNNGQLRTKRDLGLLNDVFNAVELEKLQGQAAIGHVRYSTAGSNLLENIQPLPFNFSDTQFALAHNGNLTNAQTIRQTLESRGAIYQSSSDSENLMHLIRLSKETTLDEQIKDALRQIKGGFAYLLLTKDSLYAALDPNGFRPLVVGKLSNGGFVICSETCALSAVGATFLCDVQPGQLLKIDNNGLVISTYTTDTQLAICSMEFIYFARPDSDIYGVNVHSARKRMGALLAKEHPVKADMVIGVPNSSLSAAVGQQANEQASNDDVQATPTKPEVKSSEAASESVSATSQASSEATPSIDEQQVVVPESDNYVDVMMARETQEANTFMQQTADKVADAYRETLTQNIADVHEDTQAIDELLATDWQTPVKQQVTQRHTKDYGERLDNSLQALESDYQQAVADEEQRHTQTLAKLEQNLTADKAKTTEKLTADRDQIIQHEIAQIITTQTQYIEQEVQQLRYNQAEFKRHKVIDQIVTGQKEANELLTNTYRQLSGGLEVRRQDFIQEHEQALGIRQDSDQAQSEKERLQFANAEVLNLEERHDQLKSVRIDLEGQIGQLQAESSKWQFRAETAQEDLERVKQQLATVNQQYEHRLQSDQVDLAQHQQLAQQARQAKLAKWLHPFKSRQKATEHVSQS